jgi:hypothetical protein
MASAFFMGRGNGLFCQPSDRSSSAEELTSSKLSVNNVPNSWSPGGQELSLTEDRATRKIWILPLKDRKPRLFDESPLCEPAPRFSPYGHWIADDSNESGQFEIYIRPYLGGKSQVSTEGGTEPVWNPKGRELFYPNGPSMMAVDFTAQPTFCAGKPRMVFEVPSVPTPLSLPDYDVSPNGQRILMPESAEQAQAAGQINGVLN